MKQLCYFLDGACIHIGEWDYNYATDGEPLNPMPDGAECRECTVVETEHGRFIADDHRALRRPLYPPIADQLDALWKGGDDLEQMRERVLAVKRAHPKPPQLP